MSKHKKHILFFLASLGIGGAQKIAAFVMNHIDKEYKVSILSMSNEKKNISLDESIDIYYYTMNNRKFIFGKYDEIKQAYKIVRLINPDLVIIFGSYSFPSLGIYMTGIPIIGCERGDPYTYSISRKIINKYLYTHYRYSVFQSEGARKFYNVSEEKSCVICNPCFMVEKSEEVKNFGYKFISAAGRLSVDKGFDTLIEAYDRIKSKIPNYKVVIFGEGPYRKNLEKLINKKKLNDRVILYGKVSQITDYIKQSDLFVLSSWFEGLPNVLIEAMSLGLPIVSTDCSPGGARFLMADGKRGGLIVPMSDNIYLKVVYLGYLGEKINLDNPQTLNEKIQWLKLYDRKAEYTTMVDKFAVKKYVADKIGEQYIIPTLGVWKRFEDIDFDKLPDQFVLKCTHDSGGLVICRDKSKLDIDSAKQKINRRPIRSLGLRIALLRSTMPTIRSFLIMLSL